VVGFSAMQTTNGILEQQAHEIKTRGYTVIESVLSESQINEARLALDQIFCSEAELAQKRGWHNQSYKVAFMLPQKHAVFRSICLAPKVVSLMKVLLGDDCVISSLNGLAMTPGGKPQQLHRDSFGISGHVLAINVLHTLDHFTRENGCTRVVPFSQDFETQTLGSVDKENFQSLEEKAVYIEVPAGSVIAYDGAVVHAGSSNATDKPRRALHPLFTRAWLKPQWDMPASLSPQVVNQLSAQEKELFGFYCASKRYDCLSDDIVSNVATERRSQGLRQRVRQLRHWLFEQAIRSGGRRNGD
jgi:ectoine hydroxylase-related dioxygenase (phytanoyl-CoA dioxygenase family)